MANPSRGLHIHHNSKQVHIHRWSNLSAVDPNEIIETGELVEYQKHLNTWIAFLIIKVDKRTGETTEKGYQQYKKYYQIWECFTNHERSTPSFTEVDGKFMCEFPVLQPARKKTKSRRVKLR